MMANLNENITEFGRLIQLSKKEFKEELAKLLNIQKNRISIKKEEHSSLPWKFHYKVSKTEYEYDGVPFYHRKSLFSFTIELFLAHSETALINLNTRKRLYKIYGENIENKLFNKIISMERKMKRDKKMKFLREKL